MCRETLLQIRQQPFTLNNAGADNIFLSSLTGNALRGLILIVRDSNNARQDYLSNPLTWMLDDRTLSTVDLDMYFQWAQDFYASFGQARAPRLRPLRRRATRSATLWRWRCATRRSSASTSPRSAS